MDGGPTSGIWTLRSLQAVHSTRRRSKARTALCVPASNGSCGARWACPQRPRGTIWSSNASAIAMRVTSSSERESTALTHLPMKILLLVFALLWRPTVYAEPTPHPVCGTRTRPLYPVANAPPVVQVWKPQSPATGVTPLTPDCTGLRSRDFALLVEPDSPGLSGKISTS
jgi:hypothetical protein